ncbi:hypothetical protein LJK88_30495 [Paenibacillus sp. P26]|nr:hypothetical protein LJK88_30495 [Paenibacillus sp. P26]
MSTMEMDKLSGPPRDALAEIRARTSTLPAIWLVGGSTGLLLQGVRLSSPPRDLDIYADRPDAEALHQALKERSTDEQAESQTPIYQSVLSHYEIGGAKVELVGAFEVNALGRRYVVEAGFLENTYSPIWESEFTGGQGIRLMPLAHEPLFNMLRGRDDRYEAIGQVCREHPERHLPVLETLLARNRFTREAADLARRLIGGK